MIIGDTYKVKEDGFKGFCYMKTEKRCVLVTSSFYRSFNKLFSQGIIPIEIPFILEKEKKLKLFIKKEEMTQTRILLIEKKQF